MNDDNLEERLNTWGHSSTPPVNETFADNLESELRAWAARRTAADPRPVWQPIAGLVAASLIVIAGFVALDRIRTDNNNVVVLATSQESIVILPDGTKLDSPSNLDLPDGARVEVGAEGSASVGSVLLGAGAVAEIIDGRVEILFDPSNTTTPTTMPTASTTPPTTSEPPPKTTVRPTTSEVDRTTSTPRSTRPTVTTVAELDVALTVSALSRSAVLLEWTVTPTDQIRGWEVRVRAGNRGATIATLRDPEARRLQVTGSDRGTYVVIARDRNGDIVAESNPARIE